MTDTTYENPHVEPFTIRRLNGATYYRPSHEEIAWYTDGYTDYVTSVGRGTQRKAQRKLTIAEFLAEIPDLCYAPLLEEPQECLVLYLDTEWMGVRIAEYLTEFDKGEDPENALTMIGVLSGTMKTLRATTEAIVKAASPDGYLSEDWMVTMEARLKEEYPGATFPVTEAKNKRETVHIERVGGES